MSAAGGKERSPSPEDDTMPQLVGSIAERHLSRMRQGSTKAPAPPKVALPAAVSDGVAVPGASAAEQPVERSPSRGDDSMNLLISAADDADQLSIMAAESTPQGTEASPGDSYACTHPGCVRVFNSLGALHTHMGWHKRKELIAKGAYERTEHHLKVRPNQSIATRLWSDGLSRCWCNLSMRRRRWPSQTRRAGSRRLTSTAATNPTAASSSKPGAPLRRIKDGTSVSPKQASP